MKWLAGLPLALVPWQLAQVPATTPAWLKVAGSHAVVRWQASQDALVVTWVEGLTVLAWQVRQLPAATPVWLKVAGSQAVVRWQVSQDAAVTTWPGVLPRALFPLWQVAHAPGATLAWLKNTGL